MLTPKFKIGDFVKYRATKSRGCSGYNGDIGIIVKFDKGKYDIGIFYNIIWLSGDLKDRYQYDSQIIDEIGFCEEILISYHK